MFDKILERFIRTNDFNAFKNRFANIKGQFDVNAFNTAGLALLHIACLEGRYDFVEFLLANNADPSLKTQDLDNSVLICAITGQSFPIVELLSKDKRVIEEINHQNRKGLSASHYANKSDSGDYNKKVIGLLMGIRRKRHEQENLHHETKKSQETAAAASVAAVAADAAAGAVASAAAAAVSPAELASAKTPKPAAKPSVAAREEPKAAKPQASAAPLAKPACNAASLPENKLEVENITLASLQNKITNLRLAYQLTEEDHAAFNSRAISYERGTNVHDKDQVLTQYKVQVQQGKLVARVTNMGFPDREGELLIGAKGSHNRILPIFHVHKEKGHDFVVHTIDNSAGTIPTAEVSVVRSSKAVSKFVCPDAKLNCGDAEWINVDVPTRSHSPTPGQ